MKNRRIIDFSAKTWDLLTKPAVVPDDGQTRFISRLISAFLAFLVIFMILGGIFSPAYVRPFLLAGSLPMIIGYIFSRRGFFRTGAAIAIVSIVLSSLLQVSIKPAADGTYTSGAIWLTLGIILAGFWLPVRRIALLSFAEITILFLLAFLHPALGFGSFIEWLPFQLAVTCLIIIAFRLQAVHLRKIDEQTRRIAETNIYLDAILSSMADMLFITSSKGCIVMVNKPALAALNINRDEIVGRPLSALFVDTGPAYYMDLVSSLAKARIAQNVRKRLRTGSGGSIPVSCAFTPVGNDPSDGIICSARDMTEQIRNDEELARYHENLEELVRERSIQLETANREMADEIRERRKTADSLRESEERFRHLYNNSSVGLYRTTPAGEIVMVNSAAAELLGFQSAGELMTRNLETAGFAPSYSRQDFKTRLESQGFIHGYESSWIKRDGTIVHIRESARVVCDEDGRILYYDGTFEDITDRKEAEEKIEASLREKEVLLRELNHRTKNNLQIISALVNLQAARTGNAEFRTSLKTLADRIRSMSLVHEKLYQSRDLAHIDMREYIVVLVHDLLKGYLDDTERVRFNCDIEEMNLGIDIAVPCGLIINELVTNSLKYAFPNERRGEIGVRLRSLPDKRIELTISDDGTGISDFIPADTETLGIQLVMNLAENQLQGDVSLDFSRGMRFALIFDRDQE